jgi:alpha-tubulin suppressor-like RCC1 family protein
MHVTRASRLAVLARFGRAALLGLLAACSLVESYDSDTNRTCGPGGKACGSTCVSVDDPAKGCGGDSCEPCALPNATATCSAGACAVARCAAAFANCDGVDANGCEVNLGTDVHNCESCGRVCISDNTQHVAATYCADGCHVASLGCAAGYSDCNQAYPDGCEAFISGDPANCGGCGKPCLSGHPCVASRCVTVTSGDVFGSASGSHGCVVLSTGVARCWGDDESGQLGDGAPCTAAPCARGGVDVQGLTDVVTMGVGGAHTCAVTSAGKTVSCWGSNANGQLGTGQVDGGAPLTVAFPANAPSSFIAVALGARHTCALGGDHTVWCWGDGSSGQTGAPGAPATVSTPTAVALPGGATALSAGPDFTCAVVAGAVYCWGNDAAGQLGDAAGSTSACAAGGPAACAYAPVAMRVVSDATAVSCGASVTCVLRADGTIWCTGDGTGGKLGDGTGASSNVPVRAATAPGLTFSVLRVGGAHACALQSQGGSLWCWGSDARGELFTDPAATADGGAATVAVPTLVSAASGLTGVITGTDFTCTLTADGTVSCVGGNAQGQLGQGSADGLAHFVPAAVKGLYPTP